MTGLRGYQDLLVNATTPQLWREGYRRLVWVLPTGAGKTRCAQTLIARMRAADWCAVYYFAHTTELVTQPASGFASRDVRFGFLKAGLAGDGAAAVQLCSSATAVNRSFYALPRNDGAPHRRCVAFVDEGHRVKTRTILRILSSLSAVYETVYVVIMTATPYRADGRGMTDVADALVEAVTPRELFAAGWLVDPVVYSQSPPEAECEAGAAQAMMAPGIVGDLVSTWRRRANGAPTVYRCVNRAHARDVAARFRATGVRSEHIDGTMADEARAVLLARLAIGGQESDHPFALDVLTSGGTILEEGFDSAESYRHVLAWPALWRRGEWADGLAARVAGLADEHRARYLADALEACGREGVGDEPPAYTPLGCLGDAAPSQSRGAWIQRMGRVARAFGPAEVAEWDARGLRAREKRGAVVLCHSGNLERHGYLVQHEGFQLRGDRTGAAKVAGDACPSYHPPQTVSCPHCFATVQRGAPACPACGAASAEVSAPALPRERPDVELVRRVWDPATAPPADDATKEAFLRSQWAAWRRARDAGKSYSVNWPAARYKARFGGWPDWSMNAAISRMFR